MVITAPGHAVPLGWRAKITNAGGMKEANTLDYQIATEITTDTITFNQVNSLAFTAYTSGGILEYNKPVQISNLSARMQIREKVTSDAIIHELTTQNGGIVFDDIYKTITINIPDSATTQFNFTSAVYLLEFVDNVSGYVYPFAKGSVSLEREVTR